MPKNTRRIAATAIATIILVGGGGAAAIAYWSAGGAGTGSATAASNTAISAVQSSVITGLQPGDSAQTLSGTFTNGNTSPVYVTSVTASIASVTQAIGATGSCDASDFTLASAVMTVGAQIPVGSSQGNWSGATIKFNNKSLVNQDGCKGATVNLAYAIL
jgi:hypothetical protein